MSKYAVEVKNVKKRFDYTGHKNNSLKRAITQVFKSKDKSKDSFYALNGISFNVEKGDFFGVLGRNGSGKSTLLKIISEIYQPTSGTVNHDGKIVSFIELGVGFKSELTGRENVYLNGGLLGFSKKEVDEMYDEIVQFAELEKFMDQQLKNYSSGMKVRLAFSVAIRAKADILILDEVLAVGDAAFQKKCYDYFRTLKDDGKTVILVTHGMGAVRDFCNKAIVIDEGKIKFEGGADEAADEYLKLFNKDTLSSKKESASDRWGTGLVTVDDFSIEHSNETIEIKARLSAHGEAVDNVKFGVAIKNESGDLVSGFNSMMPPSGMPLSFISGEVKVLHFISPNTLGKGSFTTNVTVVASGNEVSDKRIDIATIYNQPKETHYPTVLPVTMEVRGTDEKFEA